MTERSTHHTRAPRDARALPLSLEEQLLNAAELLHYADKFRDEVFACVLSDTGWLSDIFLDLKVFYLAHIRIIICCPCETGLRERLALWNPRGYAFDYLEAGADPAHADLAPAVQAALSRRRIPVIAFNGRAADMRGVPAPYPPTPFHRSAIAAAAAAGAHKIFLLSSVEGITRAQKLLSHLSQREAQELCGAAELNVPPETVRYLAAEQAAHEVEIVVLRARIGALFQEVFTHLGAGTLFSDDYHNVFRPARLADARDIAFLMKPYVQSKVMLPVSEDEIARSIDDFYVYSITDQIVAVAKLSDYGEAYELGKLATLPRYRAKGMAGALVKQLLQKARTEGKRYVFALTIDPRIGHFFKRLGFDAAPREELPAAWRERYDFSRSSQAYRFAL